MPTVAEIKTMAQAIAGATPESKPAALDALWRAVYAVDLWYFLGRGQDKALRPLVTKIEDRTFVLAFLDADAPPRFAAEQKLAEPGQNVPVLSLPPEGAVLALLPMIQQGVQSILFHVDGESFHSPLANTGVMFEHFHNRSPGGPDFDAMIRRARQDRTQSALDEVHTAVVSMRYWFAIADPSRPDKPLMGSVDGKTAVFLFTEQTRAIKFAQSQKAMTPEGRVGVLPMDVPRTAAWLGRNAKKGLHGAMFNAGPAGFFTDAERLSALAAWSARGHGTH